MFIFCQIWIKIKTEHNTYCILLPRWPKSGLTYLKRALGYFLLEHAIWLIISLYGILFQNGTLYNMRTHACIFIDKINIAEYWYPLVISVYGITPAQIFTCVSMESYCLQPKSKSAALLMEVQGWYLCSRFLQHVAGQEKRVEASIAYFCSASLQLNHGLRKRAGCGRSLQLWVDADPLSRDKAALLGPFMHWVRFLHSGLRADVGKAAACHQLAFHISKRQKEICWRLIVRLYMSCMCLLVSYKTLTG